MPNEKAIGEKALERYKYASEVWAPQRKREQEDLKFQVPDLQWDPKARQAREGQVMPGSNVPTPPRPILSVSKLDQPIQLVRNQQRQAHLGINIHPKSETALKETAEAYQGIYRSIEQDSHADQARGWAFDRAIKAGMGYYLITTDYDDEGGHPFDQVIRIERILYQEAVVLDPSACSMDYRDMEFAFVCEWMTEGKFKALYPKASFPDAKAEPLQFEAFRHQTPDWVRKEDNGQVAVMVASYWYTRHSLQTWCEFEDEEGNLQTVIKEEQPEGWKAPEGARERPHDVRTVWYCKLAPGGDPLQHLEGPFETNGKYIPIIPVFGNELQPFDTQRRYTGLIGPNRGAQQAYNYAASTLVERMALEPKAPFLVDPEQIDDFKSEWQQLATRNFPYLPYRRFINGQDYGIPQRAQVDASGASLAVLGLQQFENFLQAGTFAYDPSLGQSQPQRSGKAIMAEQQQFETSSSGYLYNLADISMSYEAVVIMDLIPKIYDRPGRLQRLLDEEGESEMVMLNAPFYQNQDGMPQPMNGSMPPGAEQREINLKQGAYSVQVTVGKSYQTRLQQGSEMMGEFLAAQPQFMPILGPLFLKFQDWPGAQEMGDVLKKVRDAQFPMLADQNPQSPEALAAQNQQLQMQLQQIQPQMQQMAQALQTKQVEQQGRMQEAQIKGQTDLQKAQMDQETKLAIAAMQQKFEERLAMLEHALEKSRMHEETRGKIAETAAEVALKPPDLTYKGPAPSKLGESDRF